MQSTCPFEAAIDSQCSQEQGKATVCFHYSIFIFFVSIWSDINITALIVDMDDVKVRHHDSISIVSLR